MTLIEELRKGRSVGRVVEAAAAEKIDADELARNIIDGLCVVPANVHRSARPVAIGEATRTKVNANIGVSWGHSSVEREIEKLDAALQAGADTVMDLSICDDPTRVRRALLDACPVAFGTVPIYEAALRAQESHGSIVALSETDLLESIEVQAAEGVDFMTVHAGLTRGCVEILQSCGRVADVVSRGGAFLVAWMLHNQRENPLYERFDDVLAIARRHDVTLSLGDGMRPGCIADASDRPQFAELAVLGELVDRARAAAVQVMVEGPGHIPIHEVAANVALEKKLCKGAPFYVLGPIVTDIAPGYDEITSAIGGALAAWAGADYLCYVTPSEHLGLPSIDDVRRGVVASRIAAHAADLAKGVTGAADWDLAIARARKSLDWESQAKLAIDPERVRRERARNLPGEDEPCTMCGKFCAMRMVADHLGVPEAGAC